MQNTEDPGAPGPGTIMAGNGFIARVNRVAEFVRQWRNLYPQRHKITSGFGIADLTVDDLEAVLNRARPVIVPDLDLTTEIANAVAVWNPAQFPCTLEAYVAAQIAPVIADRIRKANP